MIRDLYINSKNGVYPDINCVCVFPKAKSDSGLFWEAHWYGYLNIPIEYSGKILIGNDFIQEYYIHMGFQMPWSYKNLIELDFENGVLTNTVNHSETARKNVKKLSEVRGNLKSIIWEKQCRFYQEVFFCGYTCQSMVDKIAEASVFWSAPAGYAVDFGITDKGETLLIEVNDGYAFGCYGLLNIYYSKLLSARWAELTDTRDECDF